MYRETLRVIWKIIRRKGHGRILETYCNYIAENENHKHILKTREGTKLFELLHNTVIYRRNGTNHEVFIDVIYNNNGNLLYVTNFRKINNIHFNKFKTKNTIGDYKRNCPICSNEISYKYKNNRNRADKKNTPCRSCCTTIVNKRRKINKTNKKL